MKTKYFWILLIGALGFLLSRLIVPSDEELGLILLKGANYTKAEELLEKQYKNGVRTPELIYELSLLYEKQGKLDPSIALIKKYIARRPDDLGGYRRLSDLYLMNNQPDEYDAVLVQMEKKGFKLKPSEVRSLISFYQSKHNSAKVKFLLTRLIESGVADKEEYEELAGIYAGEKDFENSAEIMQQKLSDFASKPTIDFLLFEFWIESHLGSVRTEQALKRLAADLNSRDEPQMTLYVLGQFKENYPNLALQLVDLLQPQIEKYPELENRALAILWDHRVEREKVYQELKALNKTETIDPELQNLMFNVFLERKDEQELMELIKQTPIRQIDERSIIDMAIGQPPHPKPLLFEEMEKSLGKEYLDDHPIRALALSIGYHDKNARSELNQILENPSITRTDLFSLFELAIAAKFEKEALQIGDRLPPYTGMQENELFEIAFGYIQMEKPQIMYSLMEDNSVGKQGESAFALLDTALKRSKRVAFWLSNQKNLKKDTLEAFEVVARDAKEYPLELYVAKRLLDEYPSPYSVAGYGLALVQVGKVEIGIAIIKEVYQAHSRDLGIQDDYFTALIIAAKSDTRYHNDLSALLQERQYDKDLSAEEIREFAFIHLDTLHNYKEAADLFYRLVQENQADRDDEKTMLYLWGPQVADWQAFWIVQNAEKTSSQDFANWLEALNFIGLYSKTISLFQSRPNESLTVPAYFAAMQALAFEKRYDELKDVIDRVFCKIEKRKELEDLAIYAEEADYYQARISVWEQITSQSPNDPVAWKKLAKAQFDMHAYCYAKKSLEMFFSFDTDDSELYEAYYEYAESLRKQRDFCAANYFYRAAIREICRSETKTQRMREIASLAYFQLEDHPRAIGMMKEYFAYSGRDPEAASSFANLLMDDGWLEFTGKFLDSELGP